MSFLACEAVLRLAFAEIANSRCGSKRREEALEAALEAVTAFRELGEQRLEVGERMGRAETHGSQRKHSSCVALWQGWALIALAHTHVQKGKGQVSTLGARWRTSTIPLAQARKAKCLKS